MTKFEAPGPGMWRRDESRLTDAITPYLNDLVTNAMQQGLATAWKYYGAPLERMDVRIVAGRPYFRMRPIGAPEEPRGKPPRFVFKVLFLLHPQLRRCKKRAAEVFAKKLWRPEAERWRNETSHAYRARNLELQAIDPTELDDADLAGHLHELNESCREAFLHHFAHGGAHIYPVGDFLWHASEWTGKSVAECALALRGGSPASAEPLEQIDAVAEALRRDEDARAELEGEDDAQARLERLRHREGDVGRALEAYLCDHGNRIVTGFDFTDRRLLELPDIVLSTVRARLNAKEKPPEPEDTIREHVPTEHHALYDELRAEALDIYDLRDHEVGMGWIWRKGLTRRAMLEAAVRLRESGAIEDEAHVFEVKPDELVDLVRGGGPSAVEMARRARERAALSKLDPPLVLGEIEETPPADYFPPAVARMQNAVMTYVSHFDSDAAPIGEIEDGLSGHGVSGGRYRGRARIVLGPEDFSHIESGDVLIARTTSPTYNVLLPLLGAVVTDRGGCLSHAAIVAREYGIPGIVGCHGATRTIPDGSIVEVDGDAGTVRVVSEGAPVHDANEGARIDVVRAPEARPGGVCIALRAADEVSRFGGKSASLGASLRDGLPVPGGLALDVAFTESVAARDDAALAALRDHLAALDGPVAVRSSAVSEDGKSASFAGQHLTVLGVEGFDAIVAAVAKVWASGRSDAALAYRKRMGVEGEPQLAVAIQRLVEPTCAGVLFTRDPVTGADVRVIEATWGLGEAVVAGIVTPDHFRLSSSGAVEEKRPGEKDLAIRRKPEGGTHEVAVEGDDVHRLCLEDDHLAKLFSLASRCESVFGGPQDIEWAFVEGDLYLLQSRAVTT